MRPLGVCLIVLTGVGSLVAAEPTLKEARQRWLRGNYEEARSLYEKLAAGAKDRDAAAIGLSRTWESQGEYDKALAAVENALQTDAKNPDLLARKAELLFNRGRWDDAEKAAQAAIDEKREHFLARWIRAQIYRDRGDTKKADSECRWFVRTYTARNNADMDVKDPEELLLVGLAGAENARWNNLPDQFRFIVNDLGDDALKAEPDYWPVEQQRGMLFLEKYNRGDALDAFDKVLKINPRAAEALVGKGLAALQKYEIKDAEQFAERALKINPRLPEALTLRADIHLAGGDIAKAMAELERARQVNPRDEAILGRIAACLVLQKKDGDFQKLARDVEQFDAKPGVFYYYLAEELEGRRRYEEAEGYYKKAAELRPMLPSAQNSLGLLYMRMGRERDARPLLEKAFKADAFNVRVFNTVLVLRHLDKYETAKTAHFELRFDPKTDKLLAKYMARYLEEIYEELAAKFRYRPQGPFLIEVFTKHEMFSGRTVALPDLHTIGACTGRVVAMVSPRSKDMKKPFNWARVLRHELVHIFNLDQTRFQVSHWYTEGLAVTQEGFPRPQQWNQLLLERVPAGELMSLSDIDLGFIRPRSPLDWHMAYCQSQLYVQYMTEKFGPKTVGELLVAFRDGLDSGAAVAKVCKVSTEEFEKGYKEYLNEVVKTLKGKPAAKPLTFTQLKAEHEKDPDNVDVAAQLAEQHLVRKRVGDARKLADAVLAKNKTQPLALYVKAKLLQAAGDEDQAKALLETAAAQQPPELKVLQELGSIYYNAEDFANAARIYEQARKAEPYESKWLTELARVYTQASDKDKLIAVLKELAPTDADDLDTRKRLTRLLLEVGSFGEAERYARQALEIDVLDSKVQQALGEALLGQKRPEAAVEALAAAVEINEMDNEARLKLAQAYLDSGQKQKADSEITKVLARDPDNEDAKRLRKALEK